MKVGRRAQARFLDVFPEMGAAGQIDMQQAAIKAEHKSYPPASAEMIKTRSPEFTRALLPRTKSTPLILHA